jgi:hypothetical protein
VAHEVLSEKTVACPCGNGLLRAQLSEHDTWPHVKELSEHIDCADCREKYVIRNYTLVNKEQVEEEDRLSHARFELSRERGKLTKERYGDRWTERLLRIGTRSGACHAVAGLAGSLSVTRMYYRKLTIQAYAEELINDGENAGQILSKLGIVDDDITQMGSEVEELRRQRAMVVAAYTKDAVATMPAFKPHEYR